MAGEPVVTEQSTDEEVKEKESGEIVDISGGGDKKVTETLVKEESSTPEVTAAQLEDKAKSSAPIESISIQDTSISSTSQIIADQIEDTAKVTHDELGDSPVVQEMKKVTENDLIPSSDTSVKNGPHIERAQPEQNLNATNESAVIEEAKTIATVLIDPQTTAKIENKVGNSSIESFVAVEEGKNIPESEPPSSLDNLADSDDQIVAIEPVDKTKDAGESVIVESIKNVASDHSIPNSDILMDDKSQIVAVSEKKLDKTVISDKSIENIEHREEEPKPLPVIEQLNRVLVKLEEDQAEESEQDIKKEVKEILETANQIIEEPASAIATLAVELEKKSEEKVEETIVPELSPKVAVEMKKEIDLDMKGLTEKKIEDVDNKPVESEKEEHAIKEESIAETNSGKNEDECKANVHVPSNQGTDAEIATMETVGDDKLDVDEGSKVPEVIIREVTDTKKEETRNITATDLVETLKDKGSTEISSDIISATELVETLEDKRLAEISSDIASVANISESHNVEEKVEEKGLESIELITKVKNSINIDSATVISEKSLEGEKASTNGDTVTEEKEKIKEEKEEKALVKPTNAGEEQGSTESKSQTKLEDLIQVDKKEIVEKVGEDEADKKKEAETEDNTTQNLNKTVKDVDSSQTDRDLQKNVLSNKSGHRSSNNLLSKVKKGIVKMKKAIVGKSPSSKTLASDTKIETKQE